MTEAWNVSVEQQIDSVTAVRLAYVGTESYHQSYVQDDNIASYSYCTYYNNPTCALPTAANLKNGTLQGPVAPYSNFTSILEYDSGATASYHSLQAFVQRHLSHGLQAQTSFTWEKSIDVASVANLSNGDEMNNPRNLALESRHLEHEYPLHLEKQFHLQHSGAERAESAGTGSARRLGGKPHHLLAVGHAVQRWPGQR
jgi:hypothetical protein